MTTVRDYHDAAMIHVQDAIVARYEGRDDDYRALHAKALPLEVAAIETLEREVGTGAETEPTRSILYCGAASMALAAGDAVEANRLARIGLAGNPPANVRADLLELTT